MTVSQRVLITGGASGLGAALARAFLARGDRVVIGDLTPVEESDGGPSSLSLDVRSDSDWAAAAAWVEQTWGGLDVLVNNAGVAGGGRLDVASMAEWQWITEINLFGAVRGTRTFVPMLKRQGSGLIVNIASLAGLVHPAGMGSYNAVKAGVVALSETTAHELAGYGVRCSVVCPSYFRTGLIDGMQGEDAAVGQVIGALVAKAPHGPDEIAAAILEGLDRGEELILPDAAAQQAWALKQTDRAAYDAQMRAQAARLQALGGAIGGNPDGTPTDATPHDWRRRPMSRSELTGAQEVREEDAFDVEAVRSWLATQGTELSGPIQVRQFGSGASNLTFSLRTEDRDLVLRRPPRGSKAKGAHDMAREYRIQDSLAGVFPLVAQMVALCEDESLMGAPFYVMERIDGVIPGRDFPRGVDLDEEQVRRLCTNALDVLIDLHRLDLEDESLAPLAALDRGPGYVERQVGGWSRRFRAARTEDVGDYERVMTWLEEHRPDDVPHRLIHNDFRFDNVVLDREDPTRPVGVLDWELATVGDPLMELGGTMAYWVQADDDEFFVQARLQPTTTPGMLTRAEAVAYYCERMGFSLSADQWRFYEVFGLFRLAVIAQQIYYRYFHKQTTNEFYAGFGVIAQYLEGRCLARIEGP